MPKAKNYWLLKTEPTSYSIDDLERDGRTGWDGVRNYQARNLMRDDMRAGDLALIYHSSADPAGVVGVATIVETAIPDPTQFDPESKYFDEKSSREDPRWIMVSIAFVEKFKRTVALSELKEQAELDGMLVTKRGQRLSVQPVDKKHFEFVRKLARKKKSSAATA
ncbi:MAG: EVE domain-containing protein [Phycisphaerales bacterium]